MAPRITSGRLSLKRPTQVEEYRAVTRHMNRADKESMTAPARPPLRPSTSDRAPVDAQAPETRQIKIVDFRSGEAVIRHPDLVYYVKQGWRIESAVPHVIESEEVKLLVVLSRGAGTLSASAQD